MKITIAVIAAFVLGVLATAYLHSHVNKIDYLSSKEETAFFRLQAMTGMTADPEKKTQRGKETADLVNKILADHNCSGCIISFNLNDGRYSVVAPQPTQLPPASASATDPKADPKAKLPNRAMTH